MIAPTVVDPEAVSLLAQTFAVGQYAGDSDVVVSLAVRERVDLPRVLTLHGLHHVDATVDAVTYVVGSSIRDTRVIPRAVFASCVESPEDLDDLVTSLPPLMRDDPRRYQALQAESDQIAATWRDHPVEAYAVVVVVVGVQLPPAPHTAN